MLSKIKTILKYSTEDAVLEVYIEQTKSELVAYTRREYVESMDNLVIQMVCEKYNRRFNEGIASTGASGVSTSFKDGYSKEIVAQISALTKNARLL